METRDMQAVREAAKVIEHERTFSVIEERKKKWEAWFPDPKSSIETSREVFLALATIAKAHLEFLDDSSITKEALKQMRGDEREGDAVFHFQSYAVGRERQGTWSLYADRLDQWVFICDLSSLGQLRALLFGLGVSNGKS